MDLKEELRKLENKGVFIHLSYDHYDDGTNCNWSIRFREINKQTGWYGDNHEFGDTVDCLIAAIKFAYWLLEDDRLKWFFFNVKETVTEEGRANWRKYSDMQKLADEFVFDTLKKE